MEARPMSIRAAREDDLVAINEIFNSYVDSSPCTSRTDPMSLEDRLTWFHGHTKALPVLVAIEPSGLLVGWASLSLFRSQQTYPLVVEVSVYSRPGYARSGIGKRLVVCLCSEAARLGYRSVIAVISDANQCAVSLFQHLGFVQAGHLRELYLKHGVLYGIYYYQLSLSPLNEPA